MANVRNGNTFYIDSSSSSGTAGSFVSDKDIYVTGVFIFVDATTDTVIISDKSATSDAAGSLKISIIKAVAKDIQFMDLSQTPLRFPNGIWATVTGSPKVTLVLAK